MRRLAVLVLAIFLALGSVISSISSASAQSPSTDVSVPNGRFYPQAGGDPAGKNGFAVLDNAKGPFWREFQRLGGPEVVGYPISRRFEYGGFETQVFQKLVFQWKPAENRLDFLNVFDLLGDNGKDDWLVTVKQVPNRGKFDEANKSFDEITRNRLALLDKNPAIKAAFMGVKGDPIAMNGLPTSEVTDYPNVQVLRAQRVVLQYWKVKVPWANANTVTFANGGDVAREAGLFPAEALKPMTLVEASGPDAGNSVTTVPQTNTNPGSPPPTANQPAPPTPTTSGSNNPLLTTSEQLRLVAGSPTASPKPGVPTSIPVRVTDSGGRPVEGAVVLILVHYPLKPDDTAYATDGVFFSKTRTDAGGNIVAEFMIDAKVPSGLGITLEISALYPPTSGRINVPMTVA